MNMKWWPKALPALIAFFIATAQAQQGATLPSRDPVKQAAFVMLETHCARCHLSGRLVGRSKPARDFGNILDLDALAANRRYIEPGDAKHSVLYQVVVRNECPFDVFHDGDLDRPPPSDQELQALRKWIDTLPAIHGI